MCVCGGGGVVLPQKIRLSEKISEVFWQLFLYNTTIYIWKSEGAHLPPSPHLSAHEHAELVYITRCLSIDYQSTIKFLRQKRLLGKCDTS